MSEKEVRKAVERMSLEGTTIWSSEWTQGSPKEQLEKALSQPPDVVVLARKLEETRKDLLIETSREDPYDRGYLNALAMVRDEVEKTVRLTDDGGWEYTEED